MKKRLLIGVLLAIPLCACNNNVSSEESFDQVTMSNSYYNLDVYIENAKYELESMCGYAWDHIDDEELVNYIYEFYEQEHEYLDSIEDIYEASESINTIKSHQAEFIRTVFGATLNARIDEYANPIINNISIPAAKNEIKQFVDEIKNLISSGTLGFLDTYNRYDEFMWEFEGKVIYIVWSHGGSWDPDNPGQGDESPWEGHIEELWGYAHSLEDEVREYCDLDLTDYIDSIIVRFDNCQTAHDANYLLQELTDCVYEEALLQLKESLCNLYDEFVKSVDESISDNKIKEDIVGHEDDIHREIYSHSSIEEAINEYEISIHDAKDIIWANYQSLGAKLLQEIFEHYVNELKNDIDKIPELADAYSSYLIRINKISGDVDYLDEYLNEILDEFMEYCEALLRS